MQIKNRIISLQYPPFIMADISGNHEQNINKAFELIKATKDAGCDAVKFQTYKPEQLTMPGLGQFKGIDLYELYQSICMPYEWYCELFEYAKSIDLTVLTTVFSPEDVEWLERLGCPAYKISSYEIHYLDLLNTVKETGKPVIISTGCASFSDLTFISSRFSAMNTMFLKCVSSYPAMPEDFNLLTIPDMRMEFGMEIGLSDHSLGSAIAVASVALGATMVEKHITLSKDAIDGHFALLPDEMTKFVNDIHDAWKALGKIDYATPAKNRKYMRSLWAVEDIKQGTLFTRKNIGVLRPNDGIDATQIGNFLNKRAREDVKKGTPLHMRNIL